MWSHSEINNRYCETLPSRQSSPDRHFAYIPYQRPPPEPELCTNKHGQNLVRNQSGDSGELPIDPLRSVPGEHGTWRWNRAITGSRGSRACSTPQNSRKQVVRRNQAGDLLSFAQASISGHIAAAGLAVLHVAEASEVFSRRVANLPNSSCPQAAVRQIRKRLVPRGTVGGRMAPTRKPFFSSVAAWR